MSKHMKKIRNSQASISASIIVGVYTLSKNINVCLFRSITFDLVRCLTLLLLLYICHIFTGVHTFHVKRSLNLWVNLNEIWLLKISCSITWITISILIIYHYLRAFINYIFLDWHLSSLNIFLPLLETLHASNFVLLPNQSRK